MTATLTFDPVDLTELKEGGVLMAANERFFWPLGLALAWDHDKETGAASGLHVRQWSQQPGERERIDTEDDDIALGRRRAFGDWVARRLNEMTPDEAATARVLLRIE